MRWFGHLVRAECRRAIDGVLMWKIEDKKQLGGNRYRWENIIKMIVQ
jgi:hypothetical protein